MAKLVTVAGTSSGCYVEARRSFGRVYSKSKFFIEGPFIDEINGIFETTKQMIQIKNLNAALNMMKLFGDMVKYMDISYTELTEADGASIAESLSENCANALIQLNLRNCHGSMMDKLNKSMKKVNATVFSTHQSKTINMGSMTLSKLYPNVKRLDVNIAQIDQWNMIGEKFPHLQSLAVVIPKPKYNGFPDIASLLNASRSINTLQLQYSSIKLLQIANEVLSDLKVLNINEFTDDFYDGLPIQFKNVSNVRITSSVDNAQNPENLAFNQLQSLSLNLNFDLNDKWVHFFENAHNHGLEVLELTTNALKTDQLKEIATHQPHLKSVKISCKNLVPANEIVSFLENSKHLTLLELHSAAIGASELSILEGQLQQYWHIEYIDLTEEQSHIRFIR